MSVISRGSLAATVQSSHVDHSLPILAEKLSTIGDWGGSNLDANSLQSGSVLDAIQQSASLRCCDVL